MPLLTARASFLTLLFLCAGGADADEYTALFKARNYAQLTTATGAVLAKEPDNANALIAKARLLTVVAPDTRMDEAVALAEKCVAAHPRSAACHVGLGETLGIKAIRKGILSSLGSAGTIRESFKTAVELDPQNMAARFDLLQYYMQAPGIVGACM
jgi:hypothetical protein